MLLTFDLGLHPRSCVITMISYTRACDDIFCALAVCERKANSWQYKQHLMDSIVCVVLMPWLNNEIKQEEWHHWYIMAQIELVSIAIQIAKKGI